MLYQPNPEESTSRLDGGTPFDRLPRSTQLNRTLTGVVIFGESMKKSPELGSLQSPRNDLTVPLNDGAGDSDSLVASSQAPRKSAQSSHLRSRRNTAGSDDLGEKVSKMKIDMDNANKKKAFNRNYVNPDFRYNAEMALRVACGVVIASLIQTKNPDFDRFKEHDQQWLLFPEWYYLGGLSYCAVAVIFSAQKNVGATTREVCQAFYGVGMALVYNIILFSCINVKKYDPTNNPAYDGYVNITKNFGTSPYFVNNHNFYTVLPWLMAFTVIILLLPIETNTKKFALGNNLYFTLTIINPMNPSGKGLKDVSDPYYDTSNILKNLEMYFLVGFIGTLISFVVMFIPYPVFAINRLRDEARQASGDILELLNIIVDSYCFKNKNVDHMNFLRVKLHRKFDNVLARHSRMTALVDDVWWEQLFGFHLLLKFNRSMIKNYTRLVGSLISDVRTLNNAMQLEQYEALHFQYMKTLQREIYLIQVRSGDLLNEIAVNIHDCVEHMELASIEPLETQMERTLHRYRATQNRILRTQKVSHKDVEGNVPLNLFLFSLNSMCSTLIDFQKEHNEKEYDTGKRASSFIMKTIKAFFDPAKYTRLQVVSAFKASLAIFAGTMLAVYVYAFSHTTPNAVAFVMGSHIGGSFSVTMNRVGGVVAGSVVPSVFQFFIAQVCSPSGMNVVLSDFVLFLWVFASMYVRFSGGFASYAGLVSAFIAAGIMLKQTTDVCGSVGTASLAISSYSSMAQTSVGILLFIVVEMALCPESATRLLRQNIVQSIEELQTAFTILFGYHLASSNHLDDETMEKVRVILQVKVPGLLAEQAKLLAEANAEPMLWKPEFSHTKYAAILDSCYRLLNNNNILFKLVRWYAYRIKNKKLDTTHTVDIRNADGHSERSLLSDDSTHRRWVDASNRFQNSVDETFDTLQLLFGEGFIYADQEQTAVFMQMKEAFRLADKDGSGEIDADEVAVMLEAIFAQVGGMNEAEIHEYVDRFMEIVDHDQSGKVSFEEFTKALDDGLKLEVEVYTRRKPKAPVLQPTRASGLSAISEEQSIANGRSSVSQSLGLGATPKNPRASIEAATPQQGGGLPPLTPKRKAITSRTSSLYAPGSPMMRRQHDVLNVSDFSLSDIAAQMKTAYVEWLMENKRFEKVSMEELLLLNCLVSGAEGIARHLTAIEEICVSH